MSKNNPFLEAFKTPHNSIPFDKIENQHYLPALDFAVNQAEQEIEAIQNTDNPNFLNVIEAITLTG